MVTYDGASFVLDVEDFATATVKGTVEMATDAEVVAGTDETRYVNPKQVAKTFDVVTGTRNTTGSQNISHSLGRAPSFIFAIAKTNSYYISSV